MTNKIRVILIFICLGLTGNLMANNIQVSSGTLTGQNTTDNYTMVQFNLSWENSWRDNINWDAAWVFVKYKVSYDTVWRSAILNTTQANHIVPAGYTVFPAIEQTGAFIYRSNTGNGSVNLANIKLRWDYGLNNLNDADQVELKIFAIEMVYVPQGPFYAGDGSGGVSSQQFSQGNTSNPFFINGEIAYTLGGAPTTNIGNRDALGFIGTPDDFNFSTTQSLPLNYPKGYRDFYCMKYEITQGQYTDFLNSLTRHQQKSRVASNISGDAIPNIYVMVNNNFGGVRNRIICPSSGNGTTQPVVFSCDRPDRACNYLSWMDGAAYLDWAGLRPFTDLEFEKLSRGPIIPIPFEYAWGTTSVTCALNIIGIENGTETVDNNSNCNCNNYAFNGGDGGNGPLRVGIFATQNSTRILSGATYYGIMNISDNLQERIVTLGNAQGRTFPGTSGDGNLSANGNANTPFWPGYLGSEVTGSIGSGIRGGSFAQIIGDSYFIFAVSGRKEASNTVSTRLSWMGFRGSKTAPIGTLMNPNERK